MDDDEKVHPSTMISLILLNGLTSSEVHVSVRGIPSITATIRLELCSEDIMPLRKQLSDVSHIGYYRYSARQQIRKVIVLLAQSIDAEILR